MKAHFDAPTSDAANPAALSPRSLRKRARTACIPRPTVTDGGAGRNRAKTGARCGAVAASFGGFGWRPGLAVLAGGLGDKVLVLLLDMARLIALPFAVPPLGAIPVAAKAVRCVAEPSCAAPIVRQVLCDNPRAPAWHLGPQIKGLAPSRHVCPPLWKRWPKRFWRAHRSGYFPARKLLWCSFRRIAFIPRQRCKPNASPKVLQARWTLPYSPDPF